MKVFNDIVNMCFLGIILIPICILFLTFIQTLGEDIRKMNTKEKQQYLHYEDLADYRNYRSIRAEEIYSQTQRLQRVK